MTDALQIAQFPSEKGMQFTGLRPIARLTLANWSAIFRTEMLEVAIKVSAKEKVARLGLASLPPGWEDEDAIRQVARIAYPVAGVITLGISLFLAFHSFGGWPH